jgi:DNA-binding response OmpR family regulator
MAKILIIDDDRDIVDSMTVILTSSGHKVEVKPDTNDIVESVMQINPDLIILDIMFPEDQQAGFVAARTLRKCKHDKVKNIPILVLSAVNQWSDMSFHFSDSDISDDFMPVEAFIEKPVEPKVLLSKVKEFLEPRGK